AGWDAGQLDAEMADNAWLTCSIDPAILFDVDSEQRLDAAARRLGIDLNLISTQAGHA
ncbi:YqgE/AlgH family protein, partial [Pseudomonas syringae pv. tagetis]|uniref:YqgE/AlgH family protein n=1 Tax=Pseudomonas syringae group genomosp. 7 TaxID=251699 RepID=UPI0037700832